MRTSQDAETKGEEGRVELSLLAFNLGVQCYILSMDESMSIQHRYVAIREAAMQEIRVSNIPMLQRVYGLDYLQAWANASRLTMHTHLHADQYYNRRTILSSLKLLLDPPHNKKHPMSSRFWL